jgi:hypothetical protein
MEINCRVAFHAPLFCAVCEFDRAHGSRARSSRHRIIVFERLEGIVSDAVGSGSQLLVLHDEVQHHLHGSLYGHSSKRQT